MEYGTKTIKTMEYDQFIIISIIAVSLLVGFIIGTLTFLFIEAKENKELHEEVDKIRSFYFNEIDKWRNKYTNDDDYEDY